MVGTFFSSEILHNVNIYSVRHIGVQIEQEIWEFLMYFRIRLHDSEQKSSFVRCLLQHTWYNHGGLLAQRLVILLLLLALSWSKSEMSWSYYDSGNRNSKGSVQNTHCSPSGSLKDRYISQSTGCRSRINLSSYKVYSSKFQRWPQVSLHHDSSSRSL